MNHRLQRSSLPNYGWKTLLFLGWLLIAHSVNAQPPGFIDQSYATGFEQAVGITFDENGRMFVSEKGGKVWIVDNGVKASAPLIDLSEEVGNWRDFGMLGFALDPEFLTNGHIYMLYIVDRHHLLYYGTPAYDPNANEYFNATIGRITRYTAEAATNFSTVDYSSRVVLFGETASTGFPNLHQSHGTGQLVFGTDGTLLASFGDGASYSSVDQGSASETYFAQAITDGIITSAQNVGAYRSQMADMASGKVLRLDPSTGDGVPSNPNYNAGSPRSIQSRTWASGLRNPCRMTKRSETGSHIASDGDPGVFYIGDVGWGNREELDVMDGPGLNFGWPKFEGMTNQPGYNNATYAPPTHELAKIDWRNGNARGVVNGTIYNIGSTQIPGPNFTGNCSIGGVWYTGDDFPAEYKNTYFHADYGGDWIKNFVMNGNDDPTEVKDFKSGSNGIVYLATSPVDGGIYYVGNAQGNSNNSVNEVRKIAYASNAPPKAVANANTLYGPGPLTVSFQGIQSIDPENQPLIYDWDFGDGSANSSSANPTHTFTPASSSPTAYTVTLTVTDNEGLNNQQSLIVSVNNTPPVINSTSLDNIYVFSSLSATTLNLSASVSDAEHSASQLTYAWQTALYHNNHNHAEPIDNNASTTTTVSPVGCDGILYFYRIELTVTDAAGLSTTTYRDVFPDCGGPIAVNDNLGYLYGQANVLNVLANDIQNGSSIDPATVNIISIPKHGTASINATTGAITYTHNGLEAEDDKITYEVKDVNGTLSGVAQIILKLSGPPTAVILSPLENDQISSTEVTVSYNAQGSLNGNETILMSLDGGTSQQLFGLGGSYTFSGVSLGAHSVTMQIADAAGVPLTNAEATSTVNFTTTNVGGGTGLLGTYFDNIDLTNPLLTRVDPNVDFNWGTGSPDPLIGNDTYSVRWQGQIQSGFSEQYTFSVTTDDGFRLWIDGQLVIDTWIDQGPTTHTGTFNMIAGQKVDIEAEYYENGGGAVARIEWSSPSQILEVVPQDFLFLPASNLKAESGLISTVGSNWQTVTLNKTYDSPVVIATVNIPNSTNLPAVARVRNAAGNSFEVKVQNPSGTALSDYKIHYLVVEEGVYTQTMDGINMEAVKVNSTQTAHAGSWVMETQTYQQAYTSPVVLGQVMTENDPNWSVFWSADGTTVGNPPSNAGLAIGKNVAEDTNITRGNETIGYLVLESGGGTIDGIDFVAAVGGNTVLGIDNNASGYTYSFSGLTNPTSVILSAAGMNGGNGGWPELIGLNPLTTNSFNLVWDEDQITDSERTHIAEQIAYIVLAEQQLDQTIAFDSIPNAITTDPAINLAATATSGLPVSFTVISGPASVSGSVLTLNGTSGTVTVRASQGGNASYNSAPNVDRTFAVGLADQTITFNSLSNKVTTDAPFSVNATASSGLAISYSIVSGPATIAGNTVTLNGTAGTVTVRASQAGDGTYNPATDVDQSFNVSLQNQSITFNSLSDKLTTDPTFSVFATASSGLSVSYSIVSGPATILGNTITLNGTAGTVTVRASQGGNGTYAAAADVDQSFTVNSTNQIITFNALSDKLTTDGPFSITASATSGLAVNFSIVSGPATISGNVITLTGTAGTVTVRASQTGNQTYNPAPNVDRSFAVNAPSLLNQTITFNALSDKLTTDAPFSIAASASSGLAVSFSIVSGPATILGNTITLNGTAGTVTVRASQGGNGTYNPAPNVDQSFAVNLTNQTISFNALSDKLTTDAPFSVSATASSGLAVSFSIVSGPATISGNTITLNGTAGTVTVRASQSGNGTYSSAPNVDRSFAVTEPIGSPITVTSQISTGNDDVEENGVNGNMYFHSSDIELVYDSYNGGANQTVGLRFNGINVPQGAVITNAFVQFTTDETGTGTGSVTVQAEAADAAAQWTSTNYDASGRTRTSASVAWSPASWNSVGQAGPAQQTPDISAVIQEVVNRAGFAPGNPINIIVTGNGTRTAEAYDGSASSAAILSITYQSTGGGLQNQSITFAPIPDKETTDGSFSVSATASSGLPVNLSIVSGPATISGNTITLTGLTGTVTVRASQGGDASYNPAPNVDQSFQVNAPTLLNQTITFDPLSDKLISDSDFSVAATASSGLPVSLSIVSGPATISGNTISLTGVPGTVFVRASQAGDATYNPAPDVDQSFDVVDPSGSTTTISVQVATGNDDVEENGSTGLVYFQSSDLELVYDTHSNAFNQTIGLRFQGLNVPQGAIITNSYIQFMADETTSEATNLTIRGEAADVPAPWNSINYNVSSRNQTIESSLWNPVAWNSVGASGVDQQTSDITNVVQEVIDRPGFSIGNPINIILSGTGKRVAESYEGSASGAAKLFVTYVSGSGARRANPNLQEENKLLHVWHYPNPFSDRMYIQIDAPELKWVDIRLTNVLGQVLYEAFDQDVTKTLTVGEDLSPGVYIVQVTNGNHVRDFKVIKTE